MAEKAAPNLFILLELDPDQPWDQTRYESQLQKKRRDWSYLVNMPNAKGIAAKQNLSQIGQLETIAKNESLRKSQAAEAKAAQSSAQKEQRQKFNDQLELLQSRGYLLTKELDNLVKEFAAILTEKEIRARIKVPIRQAQTGRLTRPALESSKAAAIQQRLDRLGKRSLYDFLGLAAGTESRLLRQKANALYKQVQGKGSKTADDTLISELAGYCLDIFRERNEAERAKYDETLHLQQYDSIKEKIDRVGQVSKELSASQMEQLLQDARKQGLDPAEAREIVQEHARMRHFAVILPPDAVERAAAMQPCGYCGRLNDKEKKHCVACGQLLREPCPRCGQPVTSAETACGACGFPSGNRSYVMMLINDAERARRERDYDAAVQYLSQAADAWPARGNDTISQRLKELETQIAPARQEQESLHSQLRSAMQDRRYFEARELLGRLEKAMPQNAEAVATGRRLIESRIKQAEAKLAQARQEQDPEKAIRACQESLQLCQDYREAREMLARTPPAPPSALQAAVSGRLVRLSWAATPSQGVHYTVVRNERSRPISPAEGKVLATVSSLVFDDSTAEVGVPLYYVVYSNREGVYSPGGATLERAVLLLAEVSGLTAEVGDGRVHLRWKAPTNSQAILVRRSVGSPAATPTEGDPIRPLDNSQAVDQEVENNQLYIYTVFCQFRDERGALQTGPPTQIAVTPQRPPAPIEQMTIRGGGSTHKREVQLSWTPPDKGEVVILQAERPTGLLAGSVIARPEVAAYGRLHPAAKDGVTVQLIQPGSYYFVPLIFFQDSAYVGREHRYAALDDVRELTVQNLGHALRLQWQWPANCREVLVAYAHNGWPQPNQPPATTVALTRAQYDLYGYYDLVNPVPHDYYVTVFAVLSQDGQRMVAGGESQGARRLVSLAGRISLSYEIKKAMWGGKLALHLSVKGKGKLPGLVLTSKQTTLPMSRHDGQVVLRVAETVIEKDHLVIPLPEGTLRRQSYGKLFLEEDESYQIVTIRHPALEKLKLF